MKRLKKIGVIYKNISPGVLKIIENLDRESNKRLYKQVQEYLLERIKNGIYKPGEAIPTERELYNTLDVSRYTVRRAIQELVQAGYLYRVRGSGTFVLEDEQMNNNNNNDFIGVVLTHCEHEMEANILSGIENALQESGYRMTFMSSEDDYKKEAKFIQKLKRNDASGLIIMPAEDQKDSSAIFDLKNEQFPFVLVDRRLQDCETNCVMSDNIYGGYMAAEYLIELGHKRIAFIKQKYSKTSSIEDRIVGYKNAFKDYNLEVNEDLIFCYNEEMKKNNIYKQLHDFINKKQPTAIITVNAYAALDIVKMTREVGINIPGDISLICFDNLEFTKHLEVPITTISQYSREIGFDAANLLIDIINTEDEGINKSRIKQIYLPVKLVKRDSCQKINDEV